MREILERAGLVEQIGRGRFYRTIGEAVKAYLAEEPVDWVDWKIGEANGLGYDTLT